MAVTGAQNSFMTFLNRRQFIRRTAVATTTGVLPYSAWSTPTGTNEDIRMAVVGIRSKGRTHIKGFHEQTKGSRVVAVVDVDQTFLDRETAAFAERQEKIDTSRDVRQVLERDDIDAIVIATPNHTHSLIAIWACQAGKHVYVEKPVSHNVWEGRKLVEAARKYKRIVQTGTQARSDQGIMEAVEWIKSGNLGNVTHARGLCYKRRPSIGKVAAPTQLPDTIDYDLWCGPAQKKPLMRSRLHYDWHWVWDTGNGDLGNQGIHQMDIARWFTPHQTIAPRVMSIGGRVGYVDDGETANTQLIYHDYGPESIPIIFEVRGHPMKKDMEAMPNYKGVRIGNVIHCEGGYFNGGFAYDNDGNKVKQFAGDGGAKHRQNFIDAIRSGSPAVLNADILEGHISSALCHTANISHRLGSQLPPEDIRERIKDNASASETLDRMLEHLSDNEIKANEEKLTLGPWLEMDGHNETFIGEWANKANPLLTREYRTPYIIPETI